MWGEGMFLRPQHFQQHDLYWEQRVSRVLQATHPQPWGLVRVALDHEALQGGTLRADRLDLVFQDGSPLEAPISDPLPLSRNLNEIPQAGLETLIYACLPMLNAYGDNVQDGESTVGKPSRYTAGRVQAPDLYTRAIESELSVLQQHVTLMVEGENRDGYFCVPIAKVQKSPTGAWSTDENYVPPIFQLEASSWLMALMRRILDMLEVKSRNLAAVHREKAKSVVEFGTSDIASFWLLHTVNRTFPLLNHRYLNPKVHPGLLYEELVQLVGGLLTFSSDRSLKDIPPYRHDDLTATFQRLEDLIRSLLEMVISSRYVVIPLNNVRPSIFVGRIESDNLLENADFYLSVSSEAPASQLLENIPHKLKVGSPDDVEKILHSALPGVKLTHAAQVPSAIPVRIGNHYFALEPNGNIYERMLKSRAICIYTPKTLPDCHLELYAVTR